jgi:basic membrane protein A
MKASKYALTLLVGLTVLTAGCSSTTTAGSASAGSASSGGSKGKNEVFSLVIAQGGLTDNGYGQFTHEGMAVGTKAIGAKLSTIESQAPSDYVNDVTTAGQNSTLTIVAGVQWQDPLEQVAKKFPDKKFTGIDVSYDPPIPNVQTDLFQSEQGSYLAGIAAAAASKTHQIGFVGAVKLPVLEQFLAGYEAGAVSYDPSVKFDVAWTGSFSDQQGAKSAALAQYSRGADVVYQVAGNSGLGVIAAAQQVHKYVIGVDQDQHHLAPAEVLTSVVKRVDVAAENNIKAMTSGTWKPGVVEFDLANGGVALAPFYNLSSAIPAAAQTAIGKARAGIINGTIKVPSTPQYPTGR